MSYVKTYAMIFGWVFVVVGVVGFLITGFGDFFGMNGYRLLFFEINPAHNAVHLRSAASFCGALALVRLEPGRWC